MRGRWSYHLAEDGTLRLYLGSKIVNVLHDVSEERVEDLVEELIYIYEQEAQQ